MALSLGLLRLRLFIEIGSPNTLGSFLLKNFFSNTFSLLLDKSLKSLLMLEELNVLYFETLELASLLGRRLTFENGTDAIAEGGVDNKDDALLLALLLSLLLLVRFFFPAVSCDKFVRIGENVSVHAIFLNDNIV